jgi:hypothetical protein
LTKIKLFIKFLQSYIVLILINNGTQVKAQFFEYLTLIYKNLYDFADNYRLRNPKFNYQLEQIYNLYCSIKVIVIKIYKFITNLQQVYFKIQTVMQVSTAVKEQLISNVTKSQNSSVEVINLVPATKIDVTNNLSVRPLHTNSPIRKRSNYFERNTRNKEIVLLPNFWESLKLQILIWLTKIKLFIKKQFSDCYKRLEAQVDHDDAMTKQMVQSTKVDPPLIPLDKNPIINDWSTFKPLRKPVTPTYTPPIPNKLIKEEDKVTILKDKVIKTLLRPQPQETQSIHISKEIPINTTPIPKLTTDSLFTDKINQQTKLKPKRYVSKKAYKARVQREFRSNTKREFKAWFRKELRITMSPEEISAAVRRMKAQPNTRNRDRETLLVKEYIKKKNNLKSVPSEASIPDPFANRQRNRVKTRFSESIPSESISSESISSESISSESISSESISSESISSESISSESIPSESIPSEASIPDPFANRPTRVKRFVTLKDFPQEPYVETVEAEETAQYYSRDREASKISND